MQEVSLDESILLTMTIENFFFRVQGFTASNSDNELYEQQNHYQYAF